MSFLVAMALARAKRLLLCTNLVVQSWFLEHGNCPTYTLVTNHLSLASAVRR